MAKYDWKQLETEYILGDYKSVSDFLREKAINNNGTTRKYTSGWKDKKKQKEDRKATKTIEKVIEKQSEKNSEVVIKLNDVAEELLTKVMEATKELDKHIDMFGNVHKGIIDRSDIKKLTSALKDLKDIIPAKPEEEEDNSFIEALNGKTEDIWNEEE